VDSDSAIVQWDGDAPILEGDRESTWEAEETKVIQESEKKDSNQSNVELPLSVSRKTSDDEQVNKLVGQSAIDVWMENTSREMGITAADDELNTDLLRDLVYDPTLIEPPITEMSALTNEIQTSQSLSGNICRRCGDTNHLVKDCAQIDLGKNIIEIPKLGIFKRRFLFEGLATRPLIEKMLSQSMPRPKDLISRSVCSPFDIPKATHVR
jgi:hypothetical protein